MFPSKQTTYPCSDYLTGSSLSGLGHPSGDIVEGQGWSVDGIESVSGLSEVQMKAICESSQADALTDVSINVAPLITEPITAELAYSLQYANFKKERLETPVWLNHWTPEEETISTLTCMDMERKHFEHSLAFSQWAVSNNIAGDIQSELHVKMATSVAPPMPSRTLPRKARKKSREVESHRRFVVAERLRALQELLPAALKVNKDSVHCNRESVVDSTIGYIKYLELQLKDISASRLGGESISAPVFYLEGHGHYYPHDKFFERPLEEVFGRLMEENPTAACKLLESKGLHMVLIDFIRPLCTGE